MRWHKANERNAEGWAGQLWQPFGLECRRGLSLAPYSSFCIHRWIDRPHRGSRSSTSPVCWWHAELLSSWVCRSAPVCPVHLSRWSVGLDEDKQITASLNTSKTKILWCTTSLRQHCLPTTPVRVGADHVLPSTKVRDLDIFIDSDVTMRSHVTGTLSGCFRFWGSCAASDIQCLTTCSRRWSSRWSCDASTTATRHQRDSLRSNIVDFSRFSMLQPGWYTGHLVTSTLHLYSDTSTGCGLRSASISS